MSNASPRGNAKCRYRFAAKYLQPSPSECTGTNSPVDVWIDKCIDGSNRIRILTDGMNHRCSQSNPSAPPMCATICAKTGHPNRFTDKLWQIAKTLSLRSCSQRRPAPPLVAPPTRAPGSRGFLYLYRCGGEGGWGTISSLASSSCVFGMMHRSCSALSPTA